MYYIIYDMLYYVIYMYYIILKLIEISKSNKDEKLLVLRIVQ